MINDRDIHKSSASGQCGTAKGGEPLRFAFVGTAGNYFRVWLIATVLSILTLGLYSAWGKVKKLRYLYENTTLDGIPFQFCGAPTAVLKWYVKIFFGLILLGFAAVVLPDGRIPIALLATAVWPFMYLQYVSLRANNAAYRDICFSFTGTYWGAFYFYLVRPLLSIFSLGLRYPSSLTQIQHFWVTQHRYGTRHFTYAGLSHQVEDQEHASFDRVQTDIAWAFGLSVLLTILLCTVEACVFYLGSSHPLYTDLLSVDDDLARRIDQWDHQRSGMDALWIITMVFWMIPIWLLYALPFVVGWTCFTTLATNSMWRCSTISGHRFTSHLSISRMLWLRLTNILAISLSLGLMTPWAQVRMLRYKLESLSVMPVGSPDQERYEGSVPSVSSENNTPIVRVGIGQPEHFLQSDIRGPNLVWIGLGVLYLDLLFAGTQIVATAKSDFLGLFVLAFCFAIVFISLGAGRKIAGGAQYRIDANGICIWPMTKHQRLFPWTSIVRIESFDRSDDLKVRIHHKRLALSSPMRRAAFQWLFNLLKPTQPDLGPELDMIELDGSVKSLQGRSFYEQLEKHYKQQTGSSFEKRKASAEIGSQPRTSHNGDASSGPLLFRHRLIDLQSLDSDIRFLVGSAGTAILLALILVVLPENSERITVTLFPLGTFSMPLTNIVIAADLGIFAIGLAGMGLLEAHTPGKMLCLGLWTLSFITVQVQLPAVLKLSADQGIRLPAVAVQMMDEAAHDLGLSPTAFWLVGWLVVTSALAVFAFTHRMIIRHVDSHHYLGLWTALTITAVPTFYLGEEPHLSLFMFVLFSLASIGTFGVAQWIGVSCGKPNITMWVWGAAFVAATAFAVCEDSSSDDPYFVVQMLGAIGVAMLLPIAIIRSSNTASVFSHCSIWLISTAATICGLAILNEYDEAFGVFIVPGIYLVVMVWILRWASKQFATTNHYLWLWIPIGLTMIGFTSVYGVEYPEGVLAAPVWMFTLFAPFVLVLAGIDWAELTDLVATIGTERMRSFLSDRSWLLVTCVVSLICLIFILIRQDLQAGELLHDLSSTVRLIIAIFILTALFQIARYDGQWNLNIGWDQLVIVLLLIPISGLTAWGAESIGMVAAIAFCSGCRGAYQRYSNLALFFVLHSLMFLVIADWSQVDLRTIDAFESLSKHPTEGLAHGVVAVAILTLGAMLWLHLMRTQLHDISTPARTLAILNVSLLCLYIIVSLVYYPAGHMAETAPLIGVVILFVALGWEVLMSGHSITNLEGRWFSRRARNYLFLSYIILVVSGVLFYRFAHPQDSITYSLAVEFPSVLPMMRDPEYFVQKGIIELGVPFGLTLAVLRLGRWLKDQTLFDHQRSTSGLG